MDSVKDYFFLQFSNEEFKMDLSEVPSFSTLSFGNTYSNGITSIRIEIIKIAISLHPCYV
jgi:hypothetical protein